MRTLRDADPGLRSLVLTGAFARGEGAVVAGRAQNDYDLVAVRGLRRPRVPYGELRQRLTRDLGLHIDLAAVPAWRLPWTARSIFWYETALRGKVLFGEPLLHRIRVRKASSIAPTEGLRLLVNRAAGLLLATGMQDPHAVRIQSAKAILAAVDAQLLAAGVFPPSHRERWDALLRLRAIAAAPPGLAGDIAWPAWAFQFKVDPTKAKVVHAGTAWRAARLAVLDAVPVALRHARLRSIDEYARRDGLVDHLVYLRRAGGGSGAKRWAMNPTGRVRLATLRMLESTADGDIDPHQARRWLGGLIDRGTPLRMLEIVRMATLQ